MVQQQLKFFGKTMALGAAIVTAILGAWLLIGLACAEVALHVFGDHTKGDFGVWLGVGPLLVAMIAGVVLVAGFLGQALWEDKIAKWWVSRKYERMSA